MCVGSDANPLGLRISLMSALCVMNAIRRTRTEGYKKAEVTVGGLDTKCLSSQTMESRQPGLYLIGEAVDVTGWLAPAGLPVRRVRRRS